MTLQLRPTTALPDIPPPPDGSGIVPVAAQNDNIPPPPDGSGVAPSDPSTAEIVPSDAPQTLQHLSDEDSATLTGLLRAGRDDEAQRFAQEHGVQIKNLADVQAFRDKTGQVSRDVIAQFADVNTTTGGAAGRGVLQGLSFGLGPQIGGVRDGIIDALHGGSYTQGYDRSVDQSRAELGADDRDHWWASTAGNLAGALALPVGLERAGVTASVRAVGTAARDAAIAEGMAPAAADRIAARAISHRLATEGGIYGGLQGAGNTDGGPGERLLGGVEGAAGGALLGGVVLPATGRAAGAVGRRLSGLTDGFTSAGAQRKAGDLLAGNAIRPIEDIVNDIANRGEAVPGSAPTLGEVAGDSGLAGLQRGVANSDGKTGAAVGERHAQNAMARTAYADEALGAGNPQAIQDVAAARVGDAQSATRQQQLSRAATAEQRLANLRSGAAADRAAADEQVGTTRAAIGPAVDRTATGSAARDAFGSAYDAAKARTREAYAHPALTTPQPVDIPKTVFQGIIDTAHDFYGDGGGTMPEAMRSIIDDLAADPANTRTLTNIDRRLADVAGAAQVQGKRAEAAFANRVRGTLDSYVQENAPQEYRDALANAKAVRADQGRVFETGDAPKAFALDRYGNPVVGDTTVPTRLVRPGAPGGDTADGLIAAIGSDAAEQTVRQELRRAVDEGGITTEAQARSLATRYGEVAKRFPAVRNDLDALVNHTSRLDAAASAQRDAERATITAAEKAHINELSAAETAIKASPLSRVADSSVDPASFVNGLLGRSDGGRMLSRLASDVADNPEAVAGLRRSFGQYIVDAGSGVRNTAAGDDIPALAKTRKAISTIVTRAGDLLTPQQKIALQRVGRELKATNFAMNAGRPSGSDTAQNQSYKAILHFAPPGVGLRRMAAVHEVLTSLFSNREQVQHLITQAILDPDFAATLLKRPTAAHLDAARTRLLGRKALISSTLIAQAPEQAAARKVAGN